jgi:hypothetical protein
LSPAGKPIYFENAAIFQPPEIFRSMNWLWLLLVPILAAAVFLGRTGHRRRSQIRFIREKLAAAPRLDPERRVIVSMSTLPDRIYNLQPTIRCLLEQTRPPDEIVVAVPEFSRRQRKRYVIPEYLEKMPRVRVLRCDHDWGPATKFIPVIQTELAAGRPDTLIMIVDDDRLYPRDALETYLCYHHELSDAALTFRGGPIPRDFKWGPRMIRGAQLREPREVAVMTGCASYFIQPRFFDERLWDYSGTPDGVFYMDDIWIAGSLDRRGVEKYVVPTSAMMRTVNRQRWTMTLHDVPNGRKHNNNEAMLFFADSWKIFSRR